MKETKGSKEISEHAPDKVSEHAPDKVSEHAPDKVSEHAPDNISEHAHNHNNDNLHEHNHSHSHSPDFSKKTSNRLAKAIGHMEKVKRMVEEETDCMEVMTQLLAVRAAIDSTGRYILKEHITHCVVDSAQNGDMEAIEDLKKVIDSYLR